MRKFILDLLFFSAGFLSRTAEREEGVGTLRLEEREDDCANRSRSCKLIPTVHYIAVIVRVSHSLPEKKD